MSEQLSPQALRDRVRLGLHSTNTSGFAPGFVQCNIVILPVEYASDFLRFCQLNPKPCPLITSSNEPGDPTLPLLGDIDIRVDVPSYRVFKDGKCERELADVSEIWRDDLVTFALGCSFSFEEALLADGLEVRNVTAGVNVPMYKSNIACTSAGPFSGNMVVSMRPFLAADAIRAVQICTRFPAVHGAPIHLANPGLIGIEDINRPDYGDHVVLAENELPVFWACGVTPQLALEEAKLPFAITHSPGCMLVTDLRNSKLAVL